MSANQVRVRRRETPKSNLNKFYVLTSLVVVLMFGALAALAVAKYPDKFNFFRSASLNIISDGKRQIIRVPANGDLQEAVNRAKSGDIIELQAGATYNEITLPNKSLTDFVTVQSSAVGKLPEDARVESSQSNLMAKIITRGGGKPAVTAANGANHYRFVGIEFAPETADYIYNLVLFGADQTKLEDVPHDLEIDRCYLHPSKNGVTRRGLALNSANTIIKNSRFEGFAFPGEETQGICGWTGTKNVKILNNYIEGGAENIMFGGSDLTSVEFTPTDIEVRGNHLNKPAKWREKAAVKTLFELKNAKRVQFTDNYLENNWVGSAFRFTVRNEDGKAPFSTIEDVEIRNNIINGAGAGINILGKDDNNLPSQTLNHLNIVNNLFLNIGNGVFSDSGGYFFQISSGENVLIADNTSFNDGNTASFYGDLPKNFVMRDNIVGHGNYGIHGIDDIRSPMAQQFFTNNVFVNNKNIPLNETVFPPNNFWVQDYKSVGFVNFEQNNYNLAPNSRFKAKGTDKTDIGCDVNKLNLSLSSRKTE